MRVSVCSCSRYFILRILLGKLMFYYFSSLVLNQLSIIEYLLYDLKLHDKIYLKLSLFSPRHIQCILTLNQ